MQPLIQRFTHLLERIRQCEQQYGRTAGSVSLLAVSKTFPMPDILSLNRAGQQDFGESYLNEAINKISALSHTFITWHFIGHLQSNKTSEIANLFSWVHTVRRMKDAQLLSKARSATLPPLNICIQIKLDDNPNRGGILPHDLPPLVDAIQELPNLRLRGLMTLPPVTDDFEQQRKYFRLLHDLQAELIAQGNPLDTLSMGMTQDMEAAIAEGSTWLRIGTGLFGSRQGNTS